MVLLYQLAHGAMDWEVSDYQLALLYQVIRDRSILDIEYRA